MELRSGFPWSLRNSSTGTRIDERPGGNSAQNSRTPRFSGQESSISAILKGVATSAESSTTTSTEQSSTEIGGHRDRQSPAPHPAGNRFRRSRFPACLACSPEYHRRKTSGSLSSQVDSLAYRIGILPDHVGEARLPVQDFEAVCTELVSQGILTQ